MTSETHLPRLYPAILIRGDIHPGKVGECHEEIIDRLQTYYPMSRNDQAAALGFVDQSGTFMDRKTAFTYAKKHKLLNDSVFEGEDRLESGHLRLIQAR